MSNRAVRVLLAVASILSFSVATAGPVSAVTIRWAWAVARHPVMPSYTPAALDQGNSSAITNSVTRSSVGQYQVRLGSMATTGGVVHVSAFGSVARTCTVAGWDPNASDLVVGVSCLDFGGAHADSRFVVDFLETNSASGKLAYLWANEPSSIDPYEPSAAYSYNSTGGTNSIVRQGTGRYLVWLPGLGSDKGSVQVTAYGDVKLSCRAVTWQSNFGQETVSVKCRDRFGALADARFTLIFMQDVGVKGLQTHKSAYLWANHPLISSYVPDVRYRWSSEGTVPRVTRSSIGVYTVDMGGLGAGGGALVTATGGGRLRCTVSSIRTDAGPQQIGVRCFSNAGAPQDAPFTLAYMK